MAVRAFAFAAAAALVPGSGTPAGAATLEVVAAFDGANGDAPTAGPILGADGLLYGTARYGGATNNGTVYRLDPGTGALAALASFAGGPGGENPQAALYRDAGGALYGTALFGGADNYGTVFRLAPGADELTVLASFAYPQGASPLGPLVPDGAGNLYGLAAYGGTSDALMIGNGTLFRYGADGLTAAVRFDGVSASRPNSELARDAQGNLYGTGSYGGAEGRGTLFRYAPGAGQVEALVSFGGANPAFPEAGPVADAAGNLYGTTINGGTYDRGVIWRYAAATGAFDVLASFGSDLQGPDGALLVDAAGNLFGATGVGGADDRGAVFRLLAGSSEIETLASFTELTGFDPEGALVAGADGTLYGAAFQGGANLDGTVFRVRDAGFVTAAGVPEPANWAAVLAGLGAVGAVLRWRRRPVAAAG